MFGDRSYPDAFDTPLWSNLQTENPFLILGDVTSTGLLPLDIEGLIALYGMGDGTNDNDIYTFDTGSFYFEGLHDAGGTDTLRISDSDQIGVTIDLSLERGSLDVGSQILLRDETIGAFEVVNNTVNLTRFTTIEVVEAGAGADHITAGDVATFLAGGAGDDTLVGHGEGDTLFGGDGRDLLVGTSQTDLSYGGNGADSIEGSGIAVGGNDNDQISGTDGADTLMGGAGNDTLSGGVGSDLLFGGSGDDILDGGDGDDFIASGSGADTIIASAGADTIFGFDPGTDSLDLTDFGFDKLSDASNVMTETPLGVLISLSTGASVLLFGLQLADLSAESV